MERYAHTRTEAFVTAVERGWRAKAEAWALAIQEVSRVAVDKELEITRHPESVLQYRKSGQESEYLMRWNISLLTNEDLRSATGSGLVLDHILQLQALTSTGRDRFFQAGNNLTLGASFYLVKWKDSWVSASDLFKRGGTAS
ncbi:hypothetical protein GQ44DRAFT_778222 [Phaeosphaeriaceae sp. PMI808]|nr:hypothetical protein GQ44DRAFT_778222 [Phaeosphaeriaceae sp. PMI808]